MASSGNQHCAKCIGTLSKNTISFVPYSLELALRLSTAVLYSDGCYKGVLANKTNPLDPSLQAKLEKINCQQIAYERMYM